MVLVEWLSNLIIKSCHQNKRWCERITKDHNRNQYQSFNTVQYLNERYPLDIQIKEEPLNSPIYKMFFYSGEK